MPNPLTVQCRALTIARARVGGLERWESKRRAAPRAASTECLARWASEHAARAYPRNRRGIVTNCGNYTHGAHWTVCCATRCVLHYTCDRVCAHRYPSPLVSGRHPAGKPADRPNITSKISGRSVGINIQNAQPTRLDPQVTAHHEREVGWGKQGTTRQGQAGSSARDTPTGHQPAPTGHR